ncbi:citrate lyase subunit beta / citryl-CoA lyase [Colwellia chukchiensis]|uniref:Citrate lyase subunit beta / citryl-CoA lyase n=1 Tax=Colwellia chukchiensis TaxID=641665 RepID=A0A1H7K5B7_9GAMM|nr:CoA ester lyase [Colwellia chukchiensis]SEK81744.1 citrate lyase subunit beta / citryl-CoA lyase [Colwellia chukchiensis]
MPDVIRSLLFVPGSKPERFVKAQNSGVDITCIDLEDAVLPTDKDAARQAAIDYLNVEHSDICVRINPIGTALGLADLKALAAVNPAYIMLAKCDSVDDIKIASEVLALCNTQLIALIETPRGLANANDIALASNKVKALMFGGADMSAELRCDFDYEALLFVRSQLVLAAANAKVDLIDVPYINIKDEAGLISETKKVKALGYTAKAAIHPNQIDLIHQAFAPTKAQIDYANAVMVAVDGKDDAGVVVINGRMVDRPIILASKRILQLADAAKKTH